VAGLSGRRHPCHPGHPCHPCHPGRPCHPSHPAPPVPPVPPVPPRKFPYSHQTNIRKSEPARSVTFLRPEPRIARASPRWRSNRVHSRQNRGSSARSGLEVGTAGFLMLMWCEFGNFARSPSSRGAAGRPDRRSPGHSPGHSAPRLSPATHRATRRAAGPPTGPLGHSPGHSPGRSPRPLAARTATRRPATYPISHLPYCRVASQTGTLRAEQGGPRLWGR
jgi:hypothetical protein